MKIPAPCVIIVKTCNYLKFNFLFFLVILYSLSLPWFRLFFGTPLPLHIVSLSAQYMFSFAGYNAHIINYLLAVFADVHKICIFPVRSLIFSPQLITIPCLVLRIYFSHSILFFANFPGPLQLHVYIIIALCSSELL